MFLPCIGGPDPWMCGVGAPRGASLGRRVLCAAGECRALTAYGMSTTGIGALLSSGHAPDVPLWVHPCQLHWKVGDVRFACEGGLLGWTVEGC